MNAIHLQLSIMKRDSLNQEIEDKNKHFVLYSQYEKLNMI